MENIIIAIKNKTATIIDVRSPMEFESEHFPGAQNIPLEEVTFKVSEISAMPKPIVVYCRSGNRSGMAKTLLNQHGLADIYNGGGLYDMLNIIGN
jgi:phage shock protein E